MKVLPTSSSKASLRNRCLPRLAVASAYAAGMLLCSPHITLSAEATTATSLETGESSSWTSSSSSNTAWSTRQRPQQVQQVRTNFDIQPKQLDEEFIVWFDQTLIDDERVQELVDDIIPEQYKHLIDHIYKNSYGFSIKGKIPYDLETILLQSTFISSIDIADEIRLPPKPIIKEDGSGARGDASTTTTYVAGGDSTTTTRGRSSTSTVLPKDLRLWNLDRIDQSDLPLDGEYKILTGQGSNVALNRNAGATGSGTVDGGSGMHIYIIDSGITATHSEFTGRVVECRDFIAPENDNICYDKDGHGTHVAGIAAGSTYGVATEASIHSLRVLDDDGIGTTASIWAALDYVLPKCFTERAIINISIDGQSNARENQLVHILDGAGCTVVVAAGNYQHDACTDSPASADASVTVGSTNFRDEMSRFSNFGPCVDLYAPGEDINSASNVGGNNANTVLHGTSMAAPLVAGMIALYQSKGWNKYDLLSSTVQGKLTGGAEPHNDLAQIQPILNTARPQSRYTLGKACTLPSKYSSLIGGQTQGTIAYMDIFTDGNPQEISWDILDADGKVVESSPVYNARNKFSRQEVCVPTSGPLSLRMMDDGYSGLCCGFGFGSYKFTVDDFDNYVFGYKFFDEETMTIPRGGAKGPFLSPSVPGVGVVASGGQDGITASSRLNDACTVLATGEQGTVAILEIVTDGYPEESSWELSTYDAAAGKRDVFLASNSIWFTAHNSLYKQAVCVPKPEDNPDGLLITMYDSVGDGICCNVSKSKTRRLCTTCEFCLTANVEFCCSSRFVQFGNGSYKLTVDKTDNSVSGGSFAFNDEKILNRVQRSGTSGGVSGASFYGN